MCGDLVQNPELYEKSRYTSSGIIFIGIDEKNDFPLHWHEHLEFHFLLQGSAKIRCGSKIIKLRKHSCLIVNSNELHMGLSKIPCVCFRFKLHPSFFENKHFIFENYIYDDTVISLMQKIIELYQNTDDSSKFITKGYIYQLIGYLCTHYTSKGLTYGTQQYNNDKIQRINSVASYLHANFASKITTNELAQMAHYNYSHFCHIFKEVFGVSVSQYLLSIRINKATTLLSTTDMTVTEIAENSGFLDPNYFSRIFKKETGFSPSHYREKVQSENYIERTYI